jgi:hypothetical protein
MRKSETTQKITDLKTKVSYYTTKYINAIDNHEIFVGSKPSIDGYFYLYELALKFDKLTGENTFDLFFADEQNKYNVHTREGRKQLYFDFNKFIMFYPNR